MKRNIKKIMIYGIMLLLCVLLFQIGLRDYVTIEMIKKHKDVLQSVVHHHYRLTVLLYCAIYSLSVVCMLPFISLLSVLGGFLFGTLWATVLVDLSATAGVVMLVLLLRYFFKKNRMTVRGSSLEHFNAMIARHGVIYLLSVRLIFVIPFFLINSLLALTTIPLTTIAWTTSVGIVPATLFFTSAGSYLDHINSFSDIFSLKMIMIFGLLIVLVLAPLLFKKGKILS